ncbi:MAG: hypothetical protein WDO19_18945 [Bacteroidota bacterium]
MIVFTSILLLVLQGAVLKWLGVHRASVRSFIITIRWIIVYYFLLQHFYIYSMLHPLIKKWKLLNPGSILATLLMLYLHCFFHMGK